MAQAHEAPRTAAEPRQVYQARKNVLGVATTRRVDELRSHPAYSQLGLRVPTYRVNAVLEQGEDAFLIPLTVATDGTIIDGYARWEAARLQNRATVECIEHDLSEPEALHRLLLSHHPSPGLAPFSRILLALRLENYFREKARRHQQVGGQNKALSKLTEAERTHVRKEMARAAGVSVGTFHYATQLLRSADPAIRQALQNGEIKIYRAWRWSKEPRAVQKELLENYRRSRGMARVAERLVAKQLRRYQSNQVSKRLQQTVSADEIVSRLVSLAPDVLSSLTVIFINAPGKILVLSHEIAQNLGFQEEASHASRRADQKDPH